MLMIGAMPFNNMAAVCFQCPIPTMLMIGAMPFNNMQYVFSVLFVHGKLGG